MKKEIGHAPKDVTDALSSSDVQVASSMKDTMRQFQVFLVNFEVVWWHSVFPPPVIAHALPPQKLEKIMPFL